MYKLERIQCRIIRVLYKLNFALIVYISALVRSIGWLNFRYIRKHRLLCITHKDIHRIFPEYLAKYISIQRYNRSTRKRGRIQDLFYRWAINIFGGSKHLHFFKYREDNV